MIFKKILKIVLEAFVAFYIGVGIGLLISYLIIHGG